MGTANFSNHNASKVFAVMPECECENDCWCADDQYRDVIDYLESELSEMGYDLRESWDDEGYYPGKTIASKGVCYGKYGAVTINAVVRSAYYSGFNLDWSIEFQVDDSYGEDYFPGESEVRDQLSWLYDNPGMAAIQAPKYVAFFESQSKILVQELEALYIKLTTPLNVVGRFSNGEVVYQKA